MNTDEMMKYFEDVEKVMRYTAGLMSFIKEEFGPEDAEEVFITLASVALHDVSDEKRYKFLAEYEKTRAEVDKRVPKNEDGE